MAVIALLGAEGPPSIRCHIRLESAGALRIVHTGGAAFGLPARLPCTDGNAVEACSHPRQPDPVHPPLVRLVCRLSDRGTVQCRDVCGGYTCGTVADARPLP